MAFDEREKAEESRFKHDQELTFKINNRRNKLFGIWIAETFLKKSGDDIAAYAKEVVLADFDEPGDEDVFRKVFGDLKSAGVSYDERELREKFSGFEGEARDQVTSE